MATYLLTGVLRPASIATATALSAAAEGHDLVLTTPAATERLVRATMRAVGLDAPLLPLDVTSAASLTALPSLLAGAGATGLDGVLHAVAHADTSLLGTLLPPGDAPDDDAGTDAARRAQLLERALTTSVTSLPALVHALAPLLRPGCGVVTLTFDAARPHAGYGWMGPLKAALEAAVRSLATELGPRGVRVNAVAAGPLMTPAASAVPGLDGLASQWEGSAPLGWDARDASPVARTVLTLLGDALPSTTGTVVHADGGAHLLGL